MAYIQVLHLARTTVRTTASIPQPETTAIAIPTTQDHKMVGTYLELLVQILPSLLAAMSKPSRQITERVKRSAPWYMKTCTRATMLDVRACKEWSCTTLFKDANKLYGLSCRHCAAFFAIRPDSVRHNCSKGFRVSQLLVSSTWWYANHPNISALRTFAYNQILPLIASLVEGNAYVTNGRCPGLAPHQLCVYIQTPGLNRSINTLQDFEVAVKPE